MLARVSGTVIGMSRFCDSDHLAGHGSSLGIYTATPLPEKPLNRRRWRPPIPGNRFSLCASNDRFLTQSETALHTGFGTSTAIQLSARRAPAIMTPEDETDASCATAKSVSNDVTDARNDDKLVEIDEPIRSASYARLALESGHPAHPPFN